MKSTRWLAILVLVFLALVGYVQAEPPQLIRYQARLTDDAGVPLTGVRNLEFAIYDAAVAGSPSWSEGPRAFDLTATNGLLDVLLGEVTPVPATAFSSTDRWIEVSVDGTPLLPRQRLVSVPYSLTAMDAATVGGMSANEILQTTVAAIQQFVAAETIDTTSAFGSPLPPLAVDGNTVGLWHMDGLVGSAAKQDNAEGTAARDVTETGAMTSVAGFDGANDGAYEFPSSTTSNYITFGNQIDYQFGTNDFALECWMKLVDHTELNWAIVKRASGGNQVGFYIVVLPTGLPSFVWSGGNDDYPGACATSATTNVADGNWHYVVGVREGTTARIYVDGRLETTLTGCNNENTDNNEEMDTFRSFRNFAGALDEVRVSNAVRTEAEILAYYFQKRGPVPVYLDSAGKVLIASAATPATSAVVGFAARDQVLDVDDVADVYVVPGSVVDGFLGLTPGAVYYLQDVVGPHGWIGTTPGTVPLQVGIARSSTELIFR